MGLEHLAKTFRSLNPEDHAHLIESLRLHPIPYLLVEDKERGPVLLAGDGVPREGRVRHDLLVHEPLAEEVDHEMGLSEGLTHERIELARHHINQLHGDLRRGSPDLPGHPDAVSIQARYSERGEVFTPFITRIFLDHVR